MSTVHEEVTTPDLAALEAMLRRIVRDTNLTASLHKHVQKPMAPRAQPRGLIDP